MSWLGVVAALGLVVAVVAWKILRTQAWNNPGMPAPLGRDRIDWWLSGWKMFRDFPWLGVGPGGYPSAYPAYKVGSGQSTLFAHSLLFTLLAETGLLGTGSALVFLGAWLWRCRSIPVDRRPFAIGAGLFLLYSLVNVGSEYLVNQLVFALFLGVSLGGITAPSVKPRLSVVVVAWGLSFFALPVLAATFLSSRFTEEAKRRMADNDPQGAQRLFSSAIELDSSSWEAHHGLGLSLWAVGRRDPAAVERAVNESGRAAELNRLNGQLWWERGLLLKDIGRVDEARLALERAVALKPRDERVKKDLAAINGRSTSAVTGAYGGE
jgi:O-antigen ligase